MANWCKCWARPSWVVFIKSFDPCGNEVKDSVYVITLKGNLTVSNDTVAVGETAQLKSHRRKYFLVLRCRRNKQGIWRQHINHFHIFKTAWPTMQERVKQPALSMKVLRKPYYPRAIIISSNNVDAGLYLNVYKDPFAFVYCADRFGGVCDGFIDKVWRWYHLRKDVMLQAEAQRVES